jgi:DNA primase
MSFIDFQELKGRVDIQAACSFLQLDLKPNGKQLRGACPQCPSGGERSLVITPEKGAAYCFNAKKGGDVIWLTSHIRGESQKEAAHFLDEAFGGTSPVASEEKSTNSVTSDNSKGNSSKEREMKPLSYLQTDHPKLVGLGVLSDTAEHFECGHAPKGIMRGKLAIPIHDRDGRLIGYCGRGYEGKALTFPTGFKPEEHIFNAHRAMEGDLYLTRDPLEVLLAYENGVENVVSFLTDTIAPLQLEMLAALMDQRDCYSVELID